MSVTQDAELKELLEEALADMEDAVVLARRPNAGEMVAFHSRQAVEKALIAVGRLRGIKVSPLWDAPKMWDALRTSDGVPDISELVTALSPQAAVADPTKAVEYAWSCLERLADLFGLEKDRLAELRPQVAERPQEQADSGDSASGGEQETQATAGSQAEDSAKEAETQAHEQQHNRRHRRHGLRSARSERERRTSYVRVFLMCPRCGVRIPRKYQTARGKVPCPMCGRPMVKAT